ncbi:5-(carboxyamino)imidazole ribonucleotide synthase [Botrimarina hoheduenensis]|uniref:N5-carboxyaminoimidazole ribonucleotide synthase n=1 Tax=Botrimarina hoheduenensis TaxID=2528000 RepID=A0A5C5W8L3_9BACT|nr:5-(carboxyamino)imidazole ribonucleotide synthase [Botrimarina hoheduenensis]TWT46944.1 N5-carboxyaminoimidazole ribonucleotide synthase [Botrimarina hoheduenensis]
MSRAQDGSARPIGQGQDASARGAQPNAAGQVPLPPGSTLGVFGGGQLGRMFVHAAQRMGYRVHVFSTHHNSPAGQAADAEHVGALTDTRSIASFALGCDAATLEFENVPTESIAIAEQHTPIRPGSHVLHTTQHRVREKTFLKRVGVPVGAFAAVHSLAELRAAAATIGLPAVLKTAQMGYDGKGQLVLRDAGELADAWQTLGPGDGILEAFIPFEREVSVLVARGLDGQTALYGPIENAHAQHILDVSVLPARGLTSATSAAARQIATTVAEGLDAVGLLCVELFVLPDGGLLVNEIAPRPHNSGHLTIEGCQTSQFEQQVRAVCGLPLGSSESLAPAAMANLLGDVWQRGEPRWEAALMAGAHLHLYGKDAPRAGRKMGHLTYLGTTSQAAHDGALAARAALYSDPQEA